MKSFTLIYTALFCEAKAIIEHFGMNFIQKKPYRVYNSDGIILIVGGMGAQNTTLHVEDIFKRYKFKKAINIGIAGCKDQDIDIGSIFCTNHKLDDLPHLSLGSHNKPIEDPKELDTTLVDMEADSFLRVCKEYINSKNIFVFKVVSDHLSADIPKKEFVEKLVKNSIKKWEKYA